MTDPVSPTAFSSPTSRRQTTSPLSAGRWSLASYVISQAIGSLLYLPLARLLSPDDFGVLTEAGLVSIGVTLVAELSLSRALIRLPGDRDRLAQATFSLSLVVGLLGAVLCALAGLPMAAFYGEERLRLVLLLLAPGVLFTALGTVPHALLARELDFRRKTLPETVSIGAGGLAALAAAVLGAGLFSLVIYTLVRTALSSAVAWWVVAWRPTRRRPDRATVRRILGFGLPASGGDLALYARLNCDYAITGRTLGAERLGVYAFAWGVAAGPAALITSFFGGVGYATFARLQRDRDRLRAVYLSATRLIASICIPFFVGAVFVRQELVDVLFGSRWQDTVGPLLPFFLLQGVREICRPGAALTLATGHNRLFALCGAAMLPLTVSAVLIGSRFGITGVAWAMLIAVGGASLVWPTIAVVVLRPNVAELWRTVRIPLLLGAASAPAVALSRMLLAEVGMPAAPRFGLAVMAGVTAFGLALRLCHVPLRGDLARLKEALPEDEPITDQAVGATGLPLTHPLPVAVALPTVER